MPVELLFESLMFCQVCQYMCVHSVQLCVVLFVVTIVVFIALWLLYYTEWFKYLYCVNTVIGLGVPEELLCESLMF